MSEDHDRPGLQGAPWLDRMGREVSDEALKRISRRWSQKEWEAYLAQRESSLREMPVRNIAWLAEEREQFAPNYLYRETAAPSLDRKEAVRRLRRALRTLTQGESQAIHLVYWRGLSTHAAAKKLGVSRAALRSYLDRALNKLRQKLPPKQPIMRGQETREGPQMKVFREVCPSRVRQVP